MRKTFPTRYHRFLCKLFGIRITVIGKPVQDRGVLMVGQSHRLFRHSDHVGDGARLLRRQERSRELAVVRTDGAAAGTVFVERERRSQSG